MRKLRAAGVQFEPRPLDKAYNLGRIRDFCRRAARDRVDLVVFPECCITSYMPLAKLSRRELSRVAEPVPGGPSCRALLEIAREFRLGVAAGLIGAEPDGTFFKPFVLATPAGIAPVYRKLHPFVHPLLVPGRKFVVWDFKGWKAAPLVCYDNNLPENCRAVALLGAQIILAPHQTGAFDIPVAGMGRIPAAWWRERRRNPERLRRAILGPQGREWLMRWLPSRAYDNGVFVIFTNGIGMDGGEVRTGNTAILDPHGRVLAESRALGDDMVVADLDPRELRMNLGLMHLRSRRPSLYAMLARGPKGGEAVTRRERNALLSKAGGRTRT